MLKNGRIVQHELMWKYFKEIDKKHLRNQAVKHNRNVLLKRVIRKCKSWASLRP